MTRQRFHYADIMKGIGIILVLMGHIQRIESLGNWIYAFHMPLFFFISGMFFHNRSNFIKRKAKSLLIPYLSFAIIFFLYWWLLESRFRPTKELIDTQTQFINIFFPMNVASQTPYCFNIVLWFLPCLFVVETIYWCMNKVAKNREFITGGGILILVILYLAIGKPWLPYWIPQAIIALPFYYAGNIVFTHFLSDKRSPSLNGRILYVVIALMIVAISAIIIHEGSDMRLMKFKPNYIYFFILALTLSTATLILSKGINKCKVIEWLGINSLTIMLIHEPIKRILIFVYAHIFGINTDIVRESILHVTTLTIILILVCVPFVMFINKYCYYLLGKTR